jgi:hypothetical protein
MNLCITCSHFEPNPDSPNNLEVGLCQRIPPKKSLVTGLSIKPLNNYANVERLVHMDCGLEGKHHTDKSLSVFTPEVPNV